MNRMLVCFINDATPTRHNTNSVGLLIPPRGDTILIEVCEKLVNQKKTRISNKI